MGRGGTEDPKAEREGKVKSSKRPRQSLGGPGQSNHTPSLEPVPILLPRESERSCPHQNSHGSHSGQLKGGGKWRQVALPDSVSLEGSQSRLQTPRKRGNAK